MTERRVSVPPTLARLGAGLRARRKKRAGCSVRGAGVRAPPAMGLPSERFDTPPARHSLGCAEQRGAGDALPRHASVAEMYAVARPPALSLWEECGAASCVGVPGVVLARGVPDPAWYGGQHVERCVGGMGAISHNSSCSSLSSGGSSDEEEGKRGPCSNKRLRPQDSSDGSCSPTSIQVHAEAHSQPSHSPSSRGAQVRAVGRRTASSSSAGSATSAGSGALSATSTVSGLSGAMTPSPHNQNCSGSERLPFVGAPDTAFSPSSSEEGITTKEAHWFLGSLEEFNMSELTAVEREALEATGLRSKAKHRSAILFPDDVDFVLRWRGPTNLEERAIQGAALAEAEGSASAQPTDRRILIIHTALRDVLEGYRRSRSNAAEKSCIFSALILRVALHLKRCGIRDVVVQETVEGVAHKEATLFVQNYHISRSNFAKIVKEILKRNGEDE